METEMAKTYLHNPPLSAAEHAIMALHRLSLTEAAVRNDKTMSARDKDKVLNTIMQSRIAMRELIKVL